MKQCHLSVALTQLSMPRLRAWGQKWAKNAIHLKRHILKQNKALHWMPTEKCVHYVA